FSFKNTSCSGMGKKPTIKSRDMCLFFSKLNFCGYPEEKAVEIYGQENLEIYHSLFWPLEFTVPGRDNNRCYAKIICNKLDNERVIGFHYLGPNAGEVTQGFGAAMKCGITKDQLDNTIGIHPTCAEVRSCDPPASL
uniref:Thioredoxin reductase 3 n=1 Tax=Sinocyclocheilus grahami TaxID=75366 RepID=A0A672MNU0_SINGR